MNFYLGIHHPQWLAQTTAPLCVSHRQLRTRKKLPRAWAPWFLDSGAFTALSLDGRHEPARSYVAAVRRYAADVGSLELAAIQDFMCEPIMLQRTGKDVRMHQALTLDSYLDLRDRAPEVPWLPTLQGWEADDYLYHVDMYDRAGVDLRRAPLVGLGSVCRRSHTPTISRIVRRIAAYGLRLHGFGVKIKGLTVLHDVLASADSQAWSYRARSGKRFCDNPLHARLVNCANCLEYALTWRRRVLGQMWSKSWNLDEL